ncbi:Methyladenine glycosylase protein [Dioscorea alata]|uniref:Methyladenine glycosylase protein n=1 Tax=Dioscorea alata TaxID=55571 RepID=A0ACB7WLN5_DIOAL|nr:Methyladenine glycosylase protein [Dioscorea alata]
MPTPNTTRNVLERSPSLKDMDKRLQEKSCLSKHLQRVYPLSMHKSNSSLSLSSLSLSQNSNDSSFNSSISSWDHKMAMPFHGMFKSWERRDVSIEEAIKKWRLRCREFGLFGKKNPSNVDDDEVESGELDSLDVGELKRCKWITKSSDQVYVSFHDESWGVPIFNDCRLFELLALSGMLIDFNWTEILKRKEQYREAFANFDYNVVAKMDEKKIIEISSNKDLMIAESRVRCIVENAKCIQKVAKEFGSFSGYIWGHVNHKPMINKYKYIRSVPLRTPKAEAISKDLVRRGFRLVGPVIVYSFMQASGMAIDHLVDCFRFKDCVRIAERSWGMTNMAV